MKLKLSVLAAAFGLAGLLPAAAWAQTAVAENFTGNTTANSWKAFNGACLTAGGASGGSIPGCVGLLYYGSNQNWVGGNGGSLPDAVNSGALRFTNGCTSGNAGGCNGSFNNGYDQNGAIISNFTFNAGAGIQVIFTTDTYEGDSGGGGADGADGISFFLMDASAPTAGNGYDAAPYDIGAFGGSLGYTCSNTNNDGTVRSDGTVRGYDGLVGGYLGLGIDEYGNFLNQGDNTATGYGYVPDRIGLRGTGNIAWRWLNRVYPAQYPTSMTNAQRAAAVQKTCSSGLLWDYSQNGDNPAAYTQPTAGLADYTPIPNAYEVLSATLKIANEAATNRTQATPITYKLKITQNGLLSFWYSTGGAYLPVITGQDITAANGALPATLRFGFAGSTGGSTNIHEIQCFQAAPADQSASSAGLNQQQTSEVQTGTQVYFAYYDPNTWAGAMTSVSLFYNTANNSLVFGNAANWDASCVLTGVAAGQTCANTGGGPMAAQAPTSRSILTWSGTAGTSFEWTGGVTAAEQNELDAGDASPGGNRLNYLRGDRTNEINAAGLGLYRARASVLGDIIDSSPTWVGPPSASFPSGWSDALDGGTAPENSGQSYQTFQAGAETRTNVVYVGANDGLVHGVRSGAYSAANVYNTSAPNDGLEVLAYMPAAVVQTIHNSTVPALDFSNPQYGHNYFVDAPPGSGDLYYNGVWHSWLVGGLGAGGSAIYALDITNPSNFSESNAASLVIGEWTGTTPAVAAVPAGPSTPAVPATAAVPGTLTCVNVSACNNSLGNTYGTPLIRRLHNGLWGVIFGNGFGSASGDAGIYVMVVNGGSPVTTTTYYLSTGQASGANDGIAYVAAADLDGDHITDYVYAGDLLGHIWRFDLTSTNPANWAAGATPLFTTGAGQPITTQLLVAGVPSTVGSPILVVEFGTGQQIPLTNASATTYAGAQQYLYGIWDWNMNAWNAQSTTQFATLTAPQSIIGPGQPGTNLQAQTITGTTPVGGGVTVASRTVSSNPICWNQTTSCPTGDTQMGYYLALPGSSSTAGAEQVVYNPTLVDGIFIVNTIVPATTLASTTCTPPTPTGWTMALNPATGGAFTGSVFNVPNAAGLQLDAAGTISVVQAGGMTFGVYQDLNPPPPGVNNGVIPAPGGAQMLNVTVAAKGNRLTWIQRR